MTKTRESNKESDSEPKRDKPQSPKRGAFPTPKTEIEKANPYIPETDDDDDKSTTEPHSPKKS